MPYNNSEKQTDKEFYAQVARLLNVTPATVKKYWVEGFYEYVVRALYLKGVCRLPMAGTFGLRQVSENYQVHKDENGNEFVRHVVERDVPIFKPHDNMINDVNMMGVTKEYRKRKKKNALTENDHRRQQRAEKLGFYGSLSKERDEIAKQDFSKLLEDLKKEAEEDAG